jgi:hypothetical protein
MRCRSTRQIRYAGNKRSLGFRSRALLSMYFSLVNESSQMSPSKTIRAILHGWLWCDVSRFLGSNFGGSQISCRPNRRRHARARCRQGTLSKTLPEGCRGPRQSCSWSPLQIGWYGDWVRGTEYARVREGPSRGSRSSSSHQQGRKRSSGSLAGHRARPRRALAT